MKADGVASSGHITVRGSGGSAGRGRVVKEPPGGWQSDKLYFCDVYVGRENPTRGEGIKWTCQKIE